MAKSIFGSKCGDEYFNLDDRTYYSCQLDKGHKGNHKHTYTVEWVQIDRSNFD